jgi:hypothetical protein
VLAGDRSAAARSFRMLAGLFVGDESAPSMNGATASQNGGSRRGDDAPEAKSRSTGKRRGPISALLRRA